MLSDLLTLSVRMTELFSRAAFLAPSPNGPSASNEDPIPLRRTLYLYKLSTITIIRQRLSESSSIRDPSIFRGIVTLADCEFMADSPREGRLHLKACLEIAHARGGLATLSDLELELMCTTEFVIAALSGELPCKPVSEMEVAVHSRIPKDRSTALTAQTGFAKLECFHQGQASEIEKGLDTLLAATNGIHRSVPARSKPPDCDNLALYGLFAGFQLFTAAPRVSYTNGSHIPDSEIDISEALRLAGMLVIAATCLKNTPKQHLYDLLVRKMTRVLLDHMHISTSLLRSTTSALLWTYFVGAYITSRSPKQNFFLQGVTQLAGWISLEDWRGVRAQLKTFPYIDQEFDGPFEEVWNSAAFSAASPP
ncbi:hypothetical protein PV04_02393 [Phialophora macrospora]|uniref:Transcription factor domain-containing protein n=1 Tax=Phialophora macrospora TaxID=1851006 RepID=A0A0D2E709_9EURO|nr:hypothetical protein PV04_02393 [Phialophora macrospora]